MTTHIMQSAITTNFARFMISNCAIVSANVESPSDRGEPGIIFGVRIGVGSRVGVGVIVGSVRVLFEENVSSKSDSAQTLAANKTRLAKNITSNVNAHANRFMLSPNRVSGFKI